MVKEIIKQMSDYLKKHVKSNSININTKFAE
jgi:hypothetical protein